MKNSDSLELILKRALNSKYQNEFLDKPNIIEYVTENLSAQEFQTKLQEISTGLQAYNKQMVLTQFLKNRKRFYLELELMDTWQKSVRPIAKDYGIAAKRYAEFLEEKKYFFSVFIAGGLLGLGALGGILDHTLITLPSGILTGMSLMWIIGIPGKNQTHMQKEEVKDYLNALVDYYTVAERNKLILKEKENFSSDYLNSLNKLLGVVIDDKNEELRGQLYQERKKIDVFCKNHKKIIKNIAKLKKQVNMPREIKPLIGTKLCRLEFETTRKMNEYVQELFFTISNQNPGWTGYAGYE